MDNIALRPLSFSEIIDGAVGLYRRCAIPCILIALIAAIPEVILYGGWQVESESLGSSQLFDPTQPIDSEQLAEMLNQLRAPLLITLFAFIAGAAQAAALVSALGEAVSGGAPSLKQAFGSSLRRIHHVLIALFLIAALMVFSASWSFVLGIISAVLIDPTLLGASIGILLGGAALFGSIVFVGSAANGALPLILFERKNALSAMIGSFKLFKGMRLQVVAVGATALLVPSLVNFGWTAMIGGAEFFVSPDEALQAGFFERWILASGGSIVAALLAPFPAACWVLLYRNGKLRREGVDLEAAARRLAPS